MEKSEMRELTLGWARRCQVLCGWSRRQAPEAEGLWVAGQSRELTWGSHSWPRQVAMLLVKTEGSMDIERNKETSIKLSTLSMLLSSYQILNIGCRVKDLDLEYLEMLEVTSPCKRPGSTEENQHPLLPDALPWQVDHDWE
ncbi:unnamed protein product [Natator depressus]